MRPLLAFFGLTFAISWTGVVLAVGGLSGIPGDAARFLELIPFAVMAMLAGPGIAGLLLTGVFEGKGGFRQLWSRASGRGVEPRWYLFALLSGPASLTLVLLALSLISPVYLPGIVTSSDRVPLLLMGLGFGIAAGVFEELGWTGFAIPRMVPRHGVFGTGLILGILWGAWHLPSTAWGSSASVGEVPLGLYLGVALFSFLPPFRVLMLRVYQHTGSLLVAMLMHTGLTAGSITLSPAPISGVPFLVYHITWAGVLWTLVVLVERPPRRTT